jgi:iron complex transport system ATP-binding protein
MSALSTHDLDVTIAGKQVCRRLNLSIEHGQCWGLLGRNGVGKTTLLHTLAGLRAADGGSIRLDGRDMASLHRREVARHLGVLFQQESDPFPATVLETALTGRHPYLRPWQWETAEDIAAARDALHVMELDDLEQRYSASLSGGERQRLKVATLLTQNPALLLLDEPSNHLDPHHQLSVLALIAERCREQDRAALMTLHDVNLAARFCDHLLLLFGNGEARAGSAEELLDNSLLSRLYGHPVRCLDDGRTRCFLPA